MRKDQAYDILNLNHGADEKTVKKAYRRAAAKYHPDKHHDKDEVELKENESKFKEVKLAYEVLTGKVQEPSPGGFGNGHSNFHDMFAEAERQRREAQKNGQNIELQIFIDINLAIHGGKTKITVPTFAKCKVCDGKGVLLDKADSGFSSHKYCSSCKGHGSIQSENELNLNIPKGTKSGSRFRMMGKGGPRRSPSGKDGVLFVVASYEVDEYFLNTNHGLCVEAVVSLDVWLIGGKVEIATPKGRVVVEVPALISPDKLLRVIGKGVGDSDIFVIIKVDNNYFTDSDSQMIIKELGKSLEDRHINKDVENFEWQTQDKLKGLKL